MYDPNMTREGLIEKLRPLLKAAREKQASFNLPEGVGTLTREDMEIMKYLPLIRQWEIDLDALSRD